MPIDSFHSLPRGQFLTVFNQSVFVKAFSLSCCRQHAREMHAYEVYAYEMHANEMHAHEAHAYVVYPYEIHTREMHACETPAHEMHTRKSIPVRYTPTVVWCGCCKGVPWNQYANEDDVDSRQR